MKQAYLYSTDGKETPPDDCYRIESTSDASDEHELADIARDAADDLYSEHDGWECSWPVTFSIFTVDGHHLGDVSVELEFEPSFYISGVQLGGSNEA